MRKSIKLIAALIVVTFFALSTKAVADEPMQRTFRSSVYGGLIGGLVGGAVLLLTKKPGDHLGFIPTGAGVGVLVGAAYGLATSGLIQTAAVADIENGKLSLNIPAVQSDVTYDANIDKQDVTASLDVFKLRF